MDNEIIVVQGRPVITFDGFDEYKQRAEEIAAVIRDFDLTEENIKEAKSMLAEARKLTASLEKKRSEVRKFILEPYDELKSKVDQLTSIIDGADREVRSKVKAFEELERARKESAIREIWDKRIPMYTFPTYLGEMYHVWLKPYHLNKTTSMSKVEQDMTDYMEHLQSDINAMRLTEYPEETLVEYTNHYNLSLAIRNVQERKASQEKIKEAIVHDEDAEVPCESAATFRIKGDIHIKCVELFLKSEGIPYEKI